ncbi:tRNA1(Val) (adenine(37)-N6)-methyltransferase [Nonlabens ponticola]|uniref:tRNA1(Val) (adenine(37)-N6)-methyltransferase n=1 Tax=Nonlabens ponticola TaxID=2496866 RepID=A0A3S9MWB0_9FLAO|nr:methyltransferase [Nonlabens ponticola]AZQ43417.1 methyltransferase domain-containing protein [Nonlabens ponticola]
MSTFKFKQFTIEQDRCAQKVGTDGVLLGAWVNANEANSILDIGAGTGLISLMMAQRNHHAQIDAVELDTEAFEQCTSNFENSIWADRLYCYHASFQEFYEEVDDRYDLIISNPPFFQAATVDTGMDQARQQARFDNALPFEELIYGVYKLLASNGRFACIIPADREEEFVKIANHFQLYTKRKMYVRGAESSEVKRCLLEVSFRACLPARQESEITINHLTIEKGRHDYTEDYIQLTRDFYLNM